TRFVSDSCAGKGAFRTPIFPPPPPQLHLSVIHWRQLDPVFPCVTPPSLASVPRNVHGFSPTDRVASHHLPQRLYLRRAPARAADRHRLGVSHHHRSRRRHVPPDLSRLPARVAAAPSVLLGPARDSRRHPSRHRPRLPFPIRLRK